MNLVLICLSRKCSAKCPYVLLTVIVFRAKRADRLKMIWWDGTGLVMAYKRLEQNAFKWPAIRDGVLRLDPTQFEALFAGLDWRRVTALETLPPAAAE